MVAKAVNKELARAVKAAVKRWRRRFELPAWSVYLVEENSALDSNSARYPQAVAKIEVAEPVNEVYIWYLNTLAPGAADRIICHELGHWVMADLWEFLRGTLSKKEFTEARRLIEHIVETYTIALMQPERKQPFDPEVENG